MYTKHNGNNAKLRIFSFIPQRQRIQPRFMNHTYQTTKHTNTTRRTKTTTSTLVSPLTQSLCSYKRGNGNSGVFIFKLRNKFSNFVHFIHHQFEQFINHEKPVRSLMNNFVHFIHPYMNPLPIMFDLIGPYTKLENAIESAVKTNTDWAKQFWHTYPKQKWCHITLIY